MDRAGGKRMLSVDKLLARFLCVWLFFSAVPLSAQEIGDTNAQSFSWDFETDTVEGFSIGRFLSDAFTPRIIIDTKHIRDYVRDRRFHSLLVQWGDIRAIDAVYLKSLKIADYNIARALFLSMMAVLEHRNVDLKVPVFKSLAVPLTFEEDSLFSSRVKNLPSHIFPDSPDSAEGDRDKLQHFFASAYLTYASEAPELARTAGDLVEWGEAKFVVGGSDDPRDKRANAIGESFGRDLLIVNTLLPSDYLTLPFEHRK
jgi:hypothetical protein